MKRKNWEKKKFFKNKNLIVNVELESEVNELYAKTKVIQKFKNTLKDPLELQIYLYKKEGYFFLHSEQK